MSVLGSVIINLNSIERIRKCKSSGHVSSVQGQVVLSPGAGRNTCCAVIFVEAQEWYLAQIPCGRWGEGHVRGEEQGGGLLGRSP